MSASERLVEAGLSLPSVVPPVASYVPAKRVGSQVWTSGQIPMREGSLIYTGKVLAEVSLDQATECARLCVLNALAAVAAVTGGIDQIRSITKVVVFVASAPHFTDQALVANGASEVLHTIFGADGIHTRSAVGVAVLPLDAPVEVELVVEC